MEMIKSETININNEQDIINVRKLVRDYAIHIGLGAVNQTKIVTAASELTRNIIRYAKNGTLQLNIINHGEKIGLQMIFEDRGPGIPDISLAMIAGYTSKDGLGVGLSGSKQLVDEFDIKSEVGKSKVIVLT
jgi:serine/threonine-protein kinase RsbT